MNFEARESILNSIYSRFKNNFFNVIEGCALVQCPLYVQRYCPNHPETSRRVYQYPNILYNIIPHIIYVYRGSRMS